MTDCERVDSILQVNGMSRRRLAIKAGIPPSSLQSAMARNGALSLDMLVPISKVPGVSIAYLTDSENEIEQIQREINASYSIDEAALSLGYKICNSENMCWIEDVKTHKKYPATKQDIEQIETCVISYLKFQILEIIQKSIRPAWEPVDVYAQPESEEIDWWSSPPVPPQPAPEMRPDTPEGTDTTPTVPPPESAEDGK